MNFVNRSLARRQRAACSILAFVVLIGAARPPIASAEEAKEDATTLRAARAGHRTKLLPNSFRPAGPADEPPPTGPYRRIRYPSPAGELVAYLTADPKDGKRRPAIVWAHGGFGGIGSYYWSKQSAANDQTPKAYVDAGFVVMLPAWRGENDNPGRFELFYGEVDDAVSAIDYVSKLPYVDANRIYMGGHSTGGTIALLTALSTDKLRAAFSFGGAPDIGRVVGDGEGYGNTPFAPADRKESRLRSAIHFVGSLKTPTWYFEGERSSYVEEAQEMQRRARRAGTPFNAFIVKGGSHFDIIRSLNELLAAKIRADAGPACNIRITEPEVTAAFERQRAEARKRLAGKPLVTLTPAAAAAVRDVMRGQKMDAKAAYIEVAVGGALNISDRVDPTKVEVVESQGLRIAVAKAGAADVRGTVIDFVQKDGGGGFRITQGEDE